MTMVYDVDRDYKVQAAPCSPCTALRDPFSLPAPHHLALPPLDTSASLLSLRSRTSCLAPCRSAPSSTFRMRGTTAGSGTPTRTLAPGKRCRRPTSTGTLRTPSTRHASSRTARTRTSSLAWPVPSHPDPALPMPLPRHLPSRQAPIQRLPPTGNPGTGAALGSGCKAITSLAIQVRHPRVISPLSPWSAPSSSPDLPRSRPPVLLRVALPFTPAVASDDSDDSGVSAAVAGRL